MRELYDSRYVANEPVHDIKIVYCSDCRHSKEKKGRWSYFCNRLKRSRNKGSYCRVIEKKFGDKQGYVFWV